MVRAGLGYLAAADAARLPAAAQAQVLRELERHDAMAAAARAGFLAAFTAGAGPAGDGDYSAVSWLIHRTGITRGAAVGHSAWAKRVPTGGAAGVVQGDRTAECAAAVAAVLDALSDPAGKEDDRIRGQRYHDALQEAMRRLTAANLVPERAGQPVKAWVHITLADLLLLDADSALQEQWTEQVRARWAARRAAASQTGASDGAWLEGDAAAA